MHPIEKDHSSNRSMQEIIQKLVQQTMVFNHKVVASNQKTSFGLSFIYTINVINYKRNWKVNRGGITK